MNCHRDTQCRMIINLRPDEYQAALPLHKRIIDFQKTYNIPISRLDADGLRAWEEFEDDCNSLLEIYEPYFEALRRQKISSHKGKKYYQSLAKVK